MSAKLGNRQRGVLRALRDHKRYRHGGGWTWGSPLETERILDSLVRRGLVEVVDGAWRLTPAGEDVLGETSTSTLSFIDDEVG